MSIRGVKQECFGTANDRPGVEFTIVRKIICSIRSRGVDRSLSYLHLPTCPNHSNRNHLQRIFPVKRYQKANPEKWKREPLYVLATTIKTNKLNWNERGRFHTEPFPFFSNTKQQFDFCSDFSFISSFYYFRTNVSEV